MQDQEHIFVSERYSVLEVIGKGAMGVVLKCRDNKLGRKVAVKVLLAFDVAEAAPRFQKEAKIMAQLEHANILRTLDFGQSEDGQLYMVMEYLEGSTLQDMIDALGPMGFKDLYPTLLQICDGLDYAHSKGVLHRDIKPSNVMLIDGPNGKTVKLLDFGLSKLLHDDQGKLTKTGIAVGSPAYMSPEQSRGEAVDVRSDVYGFGCMLFHVLTGEVLFKSKTAISIIRKQVRQQPRSLRQTVNKEFRREIEALVDKCLKKEPEKRFQTVGALKLALQETREALDMEEEQSNLFTQDNSEETSRADHFAKDRRLKKILFVIPLIVLGVFAYVLYTTLEKQSIEEQELVRKPFVKPDTISDSTLAIGEVLSEKCGFHIKKNVAGEEILDSYGPVTDQELIDAVEKYKDRKITIWNMAHTTNISSKGLKKLVGLPVKVLKIDKTLVDDEGLGYISQIKTLTNLHASRCNEISYKGLSKLSALPDLQFLAVSGLKIDKRAFQAVAKLPRVYYFAFSTSGLTADDISPITQSDSIKKIGIWESALHKDLVDTIVGVKDLNTLFISKCTIGKAGLESLSNSTITNLKIDQCQLPSSKSLMILSQSKNLQILSLGSNKLRAETIADLKKSMPKCKIKVGVL